MSQKQSNNVMEIFETKKLVKICAPMVRYSKLQFRNLVKRYDCDLVFTPMILADSFCKSSKARNNEFSTNLLDTPLIVQFASNTVHEFVGASYLAAPFCNGVDLNCGCPQRWAKEMNLGCEMLKNPQLIYQLVKECRNRIQKPFTISVKTRLQSDLRDTVEVCKRLEKSGASFLTIHARSPFNNVGPIDEEALKLVVENIQIPVIGNGGVSNLKDCQELQQSTGVDGIMIANGILSNPELFSGASKPSLKCVQDWLDICYNSTLTLESYQNICDGSFDSNYTSGNIPERPLNLTFQCFHHHLVFMLEKILTRKQRQVFNNMKNFCTVLEFLNLNFGLRPRLFSIDDFSKHVPLVLEYGDRDDVYKSMRPIEEKLENVNITDYDCNQSDGRYFKSKLGEESNESCDWSNIFIEND